MIKIKYKEDMSEPHDAYKIMLKFREPAKQEYRNLRKEIDCGLPGEIDDVVILPIDELSDICFKVLPIIEGKGEDLLKLRERIKNVFNYKNSQPKIAGFFTKYSNIISLKTCYYCNIDFVNNFKDLSDYADVLDFIRRGKKEDFDKVEGVDDVVLKKIFSKQRSAKGLKDFKLEKEILENVENFLLCGKNNHFTLDHVLNKDRHLFAALSLYNFVPCCYSCNSKFKRSNQLVKDSTTVRLSPTHKEFNFNDAVRFNIYSVGKLPNKQVTKSDFTVRPISYLKKPDYAKLVNIFKLEGRYVYHKQKAVSLINNSIKYSPAKIREIAKLLKMPEAKVKADIFGRNLFEGALEDAPFTKYLRDIAYDIGIEGVKTTD